MLHPIKATVRRIVIDDIRLKVEAPTLSQALTKAREVLDVYPKEHTVKGVPFCLRTTEEFDKEILGVERDGHG